MAREEFPDPVTLERVVRLVDETASSLSRVEQRFDTAGKMIRETTKDITRMESLVVNVRKTVSSTLDETGRKYQHFIKVEFLQSTEDALNKAQSRWKAYGEETKRQLTEARGGLLGAGGGATGLTSVFKGAQSAMGSVMGQLPFGIGGILGLMLYGQKRKEEFDAAATRVGRIFDQVGQGQAVANGLRSRIVAMHAEFGSFGEEFQAVADQFREFGMTAPEVMGRVAQSAGKLGHDLMGVTTALEMANRMSPGSIAKMIGEVFEAGGEDRQSLLNDFMKLDEIGQRTHVSISRLMSTMTQSASSLRVQRQGVGDLAESYTKLYNSFRGGQFQGPGQQAAAGAAAMRGVQAAAAGIGGLSEGLMAEMSRRMGGPEGVGGIVSMQEGMGGQGRFAGKVFEQLGKLAQEVTGGGSREEQIFALQKIAPSLGFEGSRAVVDMMSGGATLKDVKEAIKPPQEKLLEAFNRRSKEESAWEKVHRQIMLHMASIGSSLLNVVMSGIDTIVKVMAEIGKKNTDWDKVSGLITKFADVQTTEAGNMYDAAKGIFASMGNGIGMPSWMTTLNQERAKREEEHKTRVKADQAQTKGDVDAVGRILESGTIGGVDKLSQQQRAQLRGSIAAARAEARASGGDDLDISLATETGVKRFAAGQHFGTEVRFGRISIIVKGAPSDDKAEEN